MGPQSWGGWPDWACSDAAGGGEMPGMEMMVLTRFTWSCPTSGVALAPVLLARRAPPSAAVLTFCWRVR